jgi:hypothetical protein
MGVRISKNFSQRGRITRVDRIQPKAEAERVKRTGLPEGR